MDFEVVCASWMEEADEKILAALRASDRWLKPEELSRQTGVPLCRVKRCLRLLRQQMGFARGRRTLPEKNRD